jgi:hypothetical protein
MSIGCVEGQRSQLGARYRNYSFASLEAEADLRWFLRVRRSGVTTPLSTTRVGLGPERRKEEKKRKKKTKPTVTGALGSLFGEVADAIEDYVKGFGIVNVALEWVARYGEFLEACASKLHESGDSHGGCRAQYNSFIWGGSGIPEFIANDRPG